MENLVKREDLKAFYSGKKIFVTGHTGFKGSWLVSMLLQLGANVKGYALTPEFDNGLFNLLRLDEKSISVIDDIRNRENLTREISSFQPEIIFHLAAQSLVRKSYQLPAETFDINVTGTANVLQAMAALEKGCVTVVITTDKVYQNREQHVLYTEDDALGGYDPYSASKACTELVVTSFRNSFFNSSRVDQHKKYLISARAGNVIGGGDWSTDRIVPDIVRALESGKTIDVRNPSAIRPWQHVLEPLAGYLELPIYALSHEQYQPAFNLGPNPEDHLTVRELVQKAISVWGSGEWIDKSDLSQPHEAGILKLDISRALQVLNWRPRLTAEKAIEWTINWYKQPARLQADFTLQQIHGYFEL